MKREVKRTERGWPGHFCCASRCHFRRNTLLECGKIKLVVSSVGRMELDGKFEEIGIDRHYETMAFHARKDGRFWDADVSRQFSFDSEWSVQEIDAEDKANDMHEAVVSELTDKLERGEKL
jgi:hypothetical protein